MLRNIPLTKSNKLALFVEKGAELGTGTERVPFPERERRRREVLQDDLRSRRIVISLLALQSFDDSRELIKVVGDPVGGLEEEEDLLFGREKKKKG